MTAKLALLCLALATSAAAAHPCPTRDKPTKPVAAPTEREVTALVQKATDRIRVAAVVDADAATALRARLRTIKATNAFETAEGRIHAAPALEKLARDAEAVLP